MTLGVIALAGSMREFCSFTHCNTYYNFTVTQVVLALFAAMYLTYSLVNLFRTLPKMENYQFNNELLIDKHPFELDLFNS
jgi:hypothetical protein